jgi:hypothetical protein
MRWRGSAKTWLLGAVVGFGGAAGPALALPDDVVVISQEGSPEQMARREFNLRKTGEFQTTTDLKDRGAPIHRPAPTDEKPKERSVGDAPVPTPPPRTVTQPLPAEVLALETNMPARVTDVLACRLEIAADRRVPVERVAAGSILLRWTVKPDGTVGTNEAVAQRGRTDPEVLSCARRKMGSWLFLRAPGGEPLNIEQALKFD